MESSFREALRTDPDNLEAQNAVARLMLESGRFYERARDGHEVELGCVRSWELPRRILLDFFIATGPERPTEVEITFAAEEGGTRVTVTHRPKPASAGVWAEWAPRYQQSWDLVLAALSHAAGAACIRG